MALESVYAQTILPSQVIVIIDGDIDGTAQMLQEKFPSVQIIEHPVSEGASASRNAGLRAATAEWIALLDDDDVWHAGKQTAFARYAREHPECGAMRSAFWQFSEPGGPSELNGFHSELISRGHRPELEASATTATPINNFDYLDIQGESLRQLLSNNKGVTSSTMFKRALLNHVPQVPDDLRTGQDWLLFVFLATTAEWHLVPGRWLFYRIHPQQITKTLGPSRWRYRLRAWEMAWKHAGTPSGHVLSDYANDYAKEMNLWFWGELKELRLAEAREMYRGAHSFLPRAARLSLLIPPPIRWRLRRLL